MRPNANTLTSYRPRKKSRTETNHESHLPEYRSCRLLPSGRLLHAVSPSTRVQHQTRQRLRHSRFKQPKGRLQLRHQRSQAQGFFREARRRGANEKLFPRLFLSVDFPLADRQLHLQHPSAILGARQACKRSQVRCADKRNQHLEIHQHGR